MRENVVNLKAQYQIVKIEKENQRQWAIEKEKKYEVKREKK